jgi:glycosyltransferase involved in cell wall biosynthesis
MRTYCTYFDRNYLFKAAALIDSLNRHEKRPFRILAVCLDEVSRTILEKMKLPNVVAVPIHLLEERDEPLLEAKKNRSLVEYYFTLTPTVILRLLERYNLEEITYVDADLYFFSSPDPIFSEFTGHSVLIHEHRFSPRHSHRIIYGKYNVGLLCFRNDEKGLAVLKWWRDRCIEWCYARLEDGKYADQLYLDDWTERFTGIRVLENIGAGVAPWNHDQYAFSRDGEGKILVDGKPLIFYHYHALLMINPDVMVLDKFHVYAMDEEMLPLLFLPYIHALSHSVEAVKAILPDFDFGFDRQTPIQSTTSFAARKAFVAQLPETTVFPQKEMDLDGDWKGYLAVPAMMVNVILPSSPPKISIVTPSLNSSLFIEECIDSVLSQNYPNLQFVIMDGGSEDDTVRIIKKYEKHISFWQSRSDGGSYAAVAEGYGHTDGEIMTWLDACDKFQPNALTTVSSIFSQYPDIRWITGRPNGFDEGGGNLWATHPLPVWSRELLLKKRAIHPSIQQAGTFWKRNLWDRTGAMLNRDMTYAVDFDLWLRFFRYTQLYTVDALLAGVRAHPERKSLRFGDAYHAEAEKRLAGERDLRQQEGDESIVPAAPFIMVHWERGNTAKTLNEMGEDLYQAGDIDKSMAVFRQAVDENRDAAAAHNNLGVIYWQKGEKEKALRHLAAAVGEPPLYKPAFINYSRMLISLNRANDARSVCSAYLQEHPNDNDIMSIIREINHPNLVE